MLVTRVSLGVQDFEPAVQQAIGRVQSFAQTAECAASVRGIGVTSLNLDLIYGLPFQTVETVVRTARQALALSPDRVAVFGYAHVPWLKRHQALISEDSLPGPLARFAQCRAIGEVMLAAGYVAVGLDHFAKPSDRLAQAAGDESLRRNFQGYTTDGAPVRIGIGASAIGSLPGGYAQNEAGVPAFAAAIGAGRLATARGIALTPEDALRRAVIERIMCGALADLPSIAQTHQLPDSGLLADAAALDQCAADGLVEWDGRRVRLTEAGRPFARNVASIFDRYLVASEKRHAQSV